MMQMSPLPFPPGAPAAVDQQGTRPRDMSSALLNKDFAQSLMSASQEAIPAWLKGFLQSPYAKWKSEGQAFEPQALGTQAFQPPMQMGQTHQMTDESLNMAPAWAMSHKYLGG